LPIALVLAWIFEITPQGITRTEDIAPDAPRRRGRTWIYVVVLGIISAAGLFSLGRYSAKLGGPAEKSIAVLPFANQSGDVSQEYFSDGLTEELITGLGRIGELRVIGRNSSFHFKGKGVESRAVGQALGVAHLLEGSVRRRGDRIRVNVQLVAAADGTQRWSQTFDRELKDIFAVQEEIARAVADRLRLTLVGPEAGATGAPRSGNIDAYNAYLQSRYHNARSNAESAAKAIAAAEEALRLEPQYAEAHASIALAWQMIAVTKGLNGKEAFERSREAAKTALSMKPDLAAARAALAYTLLYADWDLAGAEAQLRAANQKDPAVLNNLAAVRGAQRQTEEAAQLQREAIRLDPLYAPHYMNLASRLVQLDRLDEAEMNARKVLELQPKATGPHNLHTIIAVLRNQPDVAMREAQLEPPGLFHDTAVALAQQAAGNRAEANAALQQILEKHSANAPLSIAIAYAYRGEADKMFEWLERSYAMREPRLIVGFGHVLLKPYRADPRYVALAGKIGVPIAQ
jgi:serine/threonine-protein kinase